LLGDPTVIVGVLCLVSAVLFVATLPRIGGWALSFLMPMCAAVGFLAGMRARSTKSESELQCFKSRLAHEINNPLAILIDQLDSAALELDGAGKAPARARVRELKAFSDDALSAASRIAHVVRDLDDTTILRGEPRVPPKSGPIPKPIPTLCKARILVIDDEPQVAASLKRMLYRHDVTVATTGFEALSAISKQRFDVIISDVMMPEPSGMDVYERLLRTDPVLAGRFIFVTGGTYTTRARDFLAGISNTRLGKPVDPLALEQAISALHQGLEGQASDAG
jgi:CheY-like chemotaxis protein